jgi:molecular chaperone GrpE
MSTRKERSADENGGGEEIPVTFETESASSTDAKADGDAGASSSVDTDADAAEPSEEATELEGEEALVAAKQEAGEYYDRLLRLSAEFENYKKGASRELSDFRKFANEMIIKDLLGVIDNLERALTSAVDQEGSAGSIAEGVELTLKEILKILEKNGVTVIAAEGETFDPTYHQAVMQQEASDQPPNTVVQELQKGYLLHNRLLRPSMVAVSKAAAAASDETQ